MELISSMVSGTNVSAPLGNRHTLNFLSSNTLICLITKGAMSRIFVDAGIARLALNTLLLSCIGMEISPVSNCSVLACDACCECVVPKEDG